MRCKSKSKSESSSDSGRFTESAPESLDTCGLYRLWRVSLRLSTDMKGTEKGLRYPVNLQATTIYSLHAPSVLLHKWRRHTLPLSFPAYPVLCLSLWHQRIKFFF